MIYYYKKNFDFDMFQFWGGALDRIKDATQEQREEVKQRLFDCFFDEEPTETQINDFVWFECDDIFFKNEKND